MVEEDTEIAHVKKIGVLSLAGTFALVSLFSSILIGIVLYFILPLILGLLSFQLPFQISLGYLILFCVGSAIATFISLLIFGLFYNLSALITKGIKLYA